MIPGIKEIGFGPGTDKPYATLHQATASFQEMGERSITTQVRIDGSVVPDFTGWELEFKGERFVLPSAVPQAAKDNTTLNSLIDLNFTSWVIGELKRYFFMSIAQINAGTAIADQYKASVIMPLENFVELFNGVLKYYFGDKVRMDLFGMGTGIYSKNPVSVEINYTYIWDVLQKMYELFNVRWRIVYENGVYVIKVGYAADAIEEHDFEYGYKGGLLRFERQVQDEDIRNILLGRGGEKNLPYRYFKLEDPDNTEWQADPDAIPELANIYFDRLRDAAFRWYVRGWMQNPNRDNSWDSTHTFPTYSDIPEEYEYAYNRGRTDEKFNPVEFAKDDESIAKYGERWGSLEDDDDVYPTIQGIYRPGIGLVDEVVAVSEITTDDIDAAASEASTVTDIDGTIAITNNFSAREEKADVLQSEPFTIPSGSTGSLQWVILNPRAKDGAGVAPIEFTHPAGFIKAVNVATGVEYSPDGLPSGTYYAKITLYARNDDTSGSYQDVTYGLDKLTLNVSSVDTDAWKPTFEIWVKDIWETKDSQGASESDEDYATRVWEKILGDRLGNEAKVVFSTGFMSISEDYDFQIAEYPVVDRSKTITVLEDDGTYYTYQSEWKITLRKSDAEFDATGKYIPSADGGKPASGDNFYFIGIDMPFIYVQWAEETLHAKKVSELEKLAEINPTWVINLDKVRVNTVEEADYGTALIDRLSAGASVWVKDRRFIGEGRLQLFVQSITYTWNEPSDDNPYIVPDVEVVLSDKVTVVEGAVQQLQGSVEVIRSTYAKTADIESVVRRVSAPLFLKKTGEADSSTSPTTFASKVTSKNFRQGDIGGAGWGFYTETDATPSASASPARRMLRATAASSANEEGDSVLELDKLVVRKEMRVNELVVNQITYMGGKQIISAASIECTQVVEDSDGYICYFDQKQGTVGNLFRVGDIAMGQTFDEMNDEVRYYRALVTAIGENYIVISKTEKTGAGAPAKGDVIVQYGSKTVAARQFVIVRDVIGGGYERMLSDLNSVTATGKEYYFAGTTKDSMESEFIALTDNTGAYLYDNTGALLGYTKRAPSPRWFVGNSEKDEEGAYIGDFAEYYKGVLTIKGRVSVIKQDGTYVAMDQFVEENNVAYLRRATNSGTLIDGGLVLTSMIQLGQIENEQYKVYSGISGLMQNATDIASWYGGPMADKFATPTPASYAKSLFRFDGSGYFADGNIRWDSQGYGQIPGVQWTTDGIVINGGVKLESGDGDTVTQMLNQLSTLSSMFEIVTVDGNEAVHVKNGRGFYGDSFISAGGVGSDSGGGGGGGVDLNRVWESLTNNTDKPDVKIHTAHIPDITISKVTGLADALAQAGNVQSVVGQTGDITVGQIASALNSIGYLTGITSSMVTNALGYTPLDDSALTGYATETWVQGNYLALSGGTLTGDLRLKTGGNNYGSTLRFGDGNYAYLAEDEDDHLSIYASKGITFSTGSAYGIKYGNGVLKWDANNDAWHLEGNLYVDGFLACGGIGSGDDEISGEKTFLDVVTFADETLFEEASVFEAGLTSMGISIANVSGYRRINCSNDRLYIQQAVAQDLVLTNGNNSHTIVGGYVSPGSYKLYVNGTAKASSWDTTSDRRLKDEIEDVYSDRALAVLMALRPKEWTWNEKNDYLSGKRGAGFIAQEVQNVLPFAVNDSGDYLSLNYTVLHAYEIAGLQNHEERIAELEKENRELKQRLAAYATQ